MDSNPVPCGSQSGDLSTRLQNICNKWMNLLEIAEDNDGEEKGGDGDGIEESSH